MKPLQALVQECVDKGASSRTIAARAQRHGHKLSHAQVNYAQRDMVTKAPDLAMVEAFAAGLDVPPDRVLRAVLLQWYGHDCRA